jgi:uncharacterized protein Veg
MPPALFDREVKRELKAKLGEDMVIARKGGEREKRDKRNASL